MEQGQHVLGNSKMKSVFTELDVLSIEFALYFYSMPKYMLINSIWSNMLHFIPVKIFAINLLE